jgi:uncharacterized protein (TIGR00297 family)
MPVSYIFLGLMLLAGMLLAVITRKLTILAAITGGAVAALIFAGGGFTGIIMLAVFFVLGTAATSYKKEIKQKITTGGEHDSRRTVGQVLANGGMAAIAGLLAFIYPEHANVLQLMLAASLASATADTLSSELGMVHGKRFYNIITLKRDKKGLDGVISIEGLLIGVAGSLTIALIYSCGYVFNYRHLITIIVVGTIGNITDSLLGATLERKHFIGNNTVNFLNTVVAALAVLLLV